VLFVSPHGLESLTTSLFYMTMSVMQASEDQGYCHESACLRALRDLKTKLMICKNRTLRSYLLLSLLIFWTSPAFSVDTPGDPRGTEVGQSLVEWEWQRVSDATEYEVTIDGTYISVTKDPKYFSFNLWAGEHSLTVRAIDRNGAYSQSTSTIKINVNEWYSAADHNHSYDMGQENLSATSSSTSAPVLQTVAVTKPTDVRGTLVGAGTIKWEWATVTGASTYDITVDGEYSGTTQDTSFTSSNLWEGDHSMTVVAVGVNGYISPQSAKVKIWIAASS
jgi:hypothetical protein